jgi:hypothetical protein
VIRRLLARRPAAPTSPWAPLVAAGIPERGDEAAGRRVLCATSVGGAALTRTVDSLVGMGLWLRGAEVEFLLCDAALPACEVCTYALPGPERFAEDGPQAGLCDSCFPVGAAFLDPLPILVRRYSDSISQAEIAELRERAATFSVDECFRFEEDGLALGEQTRASVLRFFGKAQIHDEPAWLVEAAARRYAAGALVAARVGERILEDFAPDCIVAHHGVYVPQGVLGEVARRAGVEVVNWGPSYRNTTVIYSHENTYHRTLISEPAALWEEPLSTAQEERLLAYLEARRRGRGDWKWVTPEAALRPEMQEQEQLWRELDLDRDLPVFGALTNVLWDAQLYYEGHAFTDMLDWLWATLDHFVERPDRQLIVRIHPHEVKSGNRQPVGPEIEKRYGTLPPTIKIVPHDSSYNTYALMGLCRAVLIYGTKTGVELAPYGMPVVVGGDAWIRGKGLTIDISSRDEYTRVLDRLTELEPLGAETVARARRYAYHYFFRRMIPLSSLDPEAGGPELRIDALEQLLPGGDPGLDVICDGIVRRRPFVFDG